MSFEITLMPSLRIPLSIPSPITKKDASLSSCSSIQKALSCELTTAELFEREMFEQICQRLGRKKEELDGATILYENNFYSPLGLAIQFNKPQVFKKLEKLGCNNITIQGKRCIFGKYIKHQILQEMPSIDDIDFLLEEEDDLSLVRNKTKQLIEKLGYNPSSSIGCLQTPDRFIIYCHMEFFPAICLLHHIFLENGLAFFKDTNGEYIQTNFPLRMKPKLLSFLKILPIKTRHYLGSEEKPNDLNSPDLKRCLADVFHQIMQGFFIKEGLTEEYKACELDIWMKVFRPFIAISEQGLKVAMPKVDFEASLNCQKRFIKLEQLFSQKGMSLGMRQEDEFPLYFWVPLDKISAMVKMLKIQRIDPRLPLPKEGPELALSSQAKKLFYEKLFGKFA